MLVSELISKLMLMPQDAVAVVNLEKNELANGMTVSKVELVEAKKYCQQSNYNRDYYPEIVDEDETKLKVVDISA